MNNLDIYAIIKPYFNQLKGKPIDPDVLAKTISKALAEVIDSRDFEQTIIRCVNNALKKAGMGSIR